MVVGGVKSFRSEGSKQGGSLFRSDHRRSNGSAADVKFSVGGLNPGPRKLPAAAARYVPAGVRTADRKYSGRLRYH